MILNSKIFLDGGDPEETKKADEILKNAGLPGIQGQTTNPSLIASRFKNSLNSDLANQGGNYHMTTSGNIKSEILEFYKQTVKEMSLYTIGPISIQVFANNETSVDEILNQARDRIKWIPHGVIKFPCIKNGLIAAQIFCQEGPLNMTLVFSQGQAAAVYNATKNTKFPVYISPFVGRLDDRGENGMDITRNIMKMFEGSDHHVKVITASVRSLDHLLYAISLRSDVVTVPFKILKIWNYNAPGDDYRYPQANLKPIDYQNLKLDSEWQTFDINHELTDIGVAKFWSDWENIIK